VKRPKRGVCELETAIKEVIFGLCYHPKTLSIAFHCCYIAFVSCAQTLHDVSTLELKPVSHRNLARMSEGWIAEIMRQACCLDYCAQIVGCNSFR